MKQFHNKVALVTSASRGIGLACACKLADLGAEVYMGVRRVKDTEVICDGYPDIKSRLHPVYFDATQEDSYETLVQTIVAESKHLDILVNNFGIGRPKEDLNLVDGSAKAFWEILELNLGSVYKLCKLVIPHMLKTGGSIVNISSIGGLIPDITRIGYGVSKAAVNNITQQIALQYAAYGIRCNAVLPGLTATDAALKNMPPEFVESFLSHVPMGRMGTPQDIANGVAFLSSDAASYITGHILDIAGGYGLGTPQYAQWRKNQ